MSDAKDHVLGAVKARREARQLAVQAANNLRASVQVAVSARPELAATIAESVKMKLRKARTRAKADFAVTDGEAYYFRFRARTRKSLTDYSQILSHVVR